MLSPDPVTQAPEKGQNYNRYTYANNNPLKYSDPSGFCFSGAGADSAACAEVAKFVIASVGAFVFDGIFGGNGCDGTCKERQAALNWCKAQSACLAELRANTREKFRRRSAQVVQYAIENGLSYYFESGRAHIGDRAGTGGDATSQNPVVGQEIPRENATTAQLLALGKLASQTLIWLKGLDPDQLIAHFPDLASLQNAVGGAAQLAAIRRQMEGDLAGIVIDTTKEYVLSASATIIAAPLDIGLGAVWEAYGTYSTVRTALESGGWFESDFEVGIGCQATTTGAECNGVIRVDR